MPDGKQKHPVPIKPIPAMRRLAACLSVERLTVSADISSAAPCQLATLQGGALYVGFTSEGRHVVPAQARPKCATFGHREASTNAPTHTSHRTRRPHQHDRLRPSPWGQNRHGAWTPIGARKPLAVKGDVLAYLRSRHGRCFAGVPNLQSVPNAIRFGEELEGRIVFSTRPDRVDYHIHDRIDLGADEAVVIAPMPVARLRSADGGARDPRGSAHGLGAAERS